MEGFGHMPDHLLSNGNSVFILRMVILDTRAGFETI